MNRFAFGDFVVTAKAVPNVKLGTEVQITGFIVIGGRLQYTAVVFNEKGDFQKFIGPLPEQAFRFRCGPTQSECDKLLALMIKNTK